MLDNKKLFASFKFAAEGLKQSYIAEQNFRIEIFVFLLIILAGLCFQLKLIEWLWVIMSGFLVLIAELLNTAIERLTDWTVNQRKNILARQAKDVAAAAVLLSAAQAVIAGSIIFLPKIYVLFMTRS